MATARNTTGFPWQGEQGSRDLAAGLPIVSGALSRAEASGGGLQEAVTWAYASGSRRVFCAWFASGPTTRTPPTTADNVGWTTVVRFGASLCAGTKGRQRARYLVDLEHAEVEIRRRPLGGGAWTTITLTNTGRVQLTSTFDFTTAGGRFELEVRFRAFDALSPGSVWAVGFAESKMANAQL